MFYFTLTFRYDSFFSHCIYLIHLFLVLFVNKSHLFWQLSWCSLRQSFGLLFMKGSCCNKGVLRPLCLEKNHCWISRAGAITCRMKGRLHKKVVNFKNVTFFLAEWLGMTVFLLCVLSRVQTAQHSYYHFCYKNKNFHPLQTRFSVKFYVSFFSEYFPKVWFSNIHIFILVSSEFVLE